MLSVVLVFIIYLVDKVWVCFFSIFVFGFLFVFLFLLFCLLFVLVSFLLWSNWTVSGKLVFKF